MRKNMQNVFVEMGCLIQYNVYYFHLFNYKFHYFIFLYSEMVFHSINVPCFHYVVSVLGHRFIHFPQYSEAGMVLYYPNGNP